MDWRLAGIFFDETDRRDQIAMRKARAWYKYNRLPEVIRYNVCITEDGDIVFSLFTYGMKWLARDKDGTLHLWFEPPRKSDREWVAGAFGQILDRKDTFWELNKDHWPQVRWEDEYPTEYNLYDDEVINRLEATK